MQQKRKVFIALKMAGIAGQEKLAGVFRYLRERYGERSPWDVQLVRTKGELTEDVLGNAIAGGADGFIVSIPDTEDAVGPLLGTLAPTIVMDIHSDALERRAENIVFIRNSAEAIGSEAAHFLLGQGVAKSYAFLHSDPVMDWSRARFEVFRRTLGDAGLWCAELFSPADATKLKRPAAVFCACDDRAFELEKLLSAKRIKVPQDIAVLGVDNDALICENAHPRLSSVQPDFDEEGHLAAKTLDEMMNGRKPPKRTLFVGVRGIVQRESTAEQSHSGRLVQKAVAYINRHALEGIGVRDVVKHLKCSRRLADLRFRELQGRSILDAITERRLDEVKHRLVETRDKIDKIAEDCGYRSGNYLKNLFKRRYSMSMSDFRAASRQTPADM